MWGKVGDRCSKTGIAVLALLFAGIVFGGLAVAQTKRSGGPTPSPSGAEVYFIDLKDGATVPALSSVEVHFSESVKGVEAGDLLINGVPATNVVAYSTDVYVFQFPQPATGLVQVTWSGAHGICMLAVTGKLQVATQASVQRLLDLHRQAVHAVLKRADLHVEARARATGHDRQGACDVRQGPQAGRQCALPHALQVAGDVAADPVDDREFRRPVRLELGDQLLDVIERPHVQLQLLDAADLIRGMFLDHATSATTLPCGRARPRARAA